MGTDMRHYYAIRKCHSYTQLVVCNSKLERNWYVVLGDPLGCEVAAVTSKEARKYRRHVVWLDIVKGQK